MDDVLFFRVSLKDVRLNGLKSLNVITYRPFKTLNDLRVKYLGKQGLITELSKMMKDVPNDQKKEFGMLVNEVRNFVTNDLDTKKEEIEKKLLNEKLESEKIDITLPATKVSVGAPNILEKVVEDMEELFMSMGYDVVEGPEIEEDLDRKSVV